MVADAIIGIAVGVGVGVGVVFCIIIVLVVLICVRKCKTGGTKKTDDINTKTDTNMYTMDPVNDKNIDDE